MGEQMELKSASPENTICWVTCTCLPNTGVGTREAPRARRQMKKLTGLGFGSELQKIKCTSITNILRKSSAGPAAESSLSTGLVCLVRRVGEKESRILKSGISCQFMTQIHRDVPSSASSSDFLMVLVTIPTQLSSV